MRLILSVDALSPDLTGIGRYTWELASRLPGESKLEEVRYLRNGAWVSDPGALLIPATALRRSSLPISIRKPRWLRDMGLKRSCRGRIFHGTNYFLPHYADLGVVTVHDLSVFKFPETHPVERIRQFERDFFRSMTQAYHLIVDSESTRQELVSFLGCHEGRITAIPLGVSPRFAPRERTTVAETLAKYGVEYGAYSLCVSTLEPRKRIDALLKAYRSLPIRLRARFPLVLAGGKGWLSEDLQREIERCREEGWLYYLGFVSEADLPTLYAGARLFAYPSSYEGFGLPVLEAMASGVPVVTSNRTSLPEVTQGAAALVDPDDIDALTVALEAGLDDEPWRARAGERGITVAQKFSWETCIEKTVKVYQRMAQGARL